MIPLIGGAWDSQSHRDRKLSISCQGRWETALRSYCLVGTVSQWLQMKKFFNMDSGDGCTWYECAHCTEMHTPKTVKTVNFMLWTFWHS